MLSELLGNVHIQYVCRHNDYGIVVSIYHKYWIYIYHYDIQYIQNVNENGK